MIKKPVGVPEVDEVPWWTPEGKNEARHIKPNVPTASQNGSDNCEQCELQRVEATQEGLGLAASEAPKEEGARSKSRAKRIRHQQKPS